MNARDLAWMRREQLRQTVYAALVSQRKASLIRGGVLTARNDAAAVTEALSAIPAIETWLSGEIAPSM